LILRYLGVSDADMEKGQMRVEVNISLSRINGESRKELGTKVEIKNLNSLKAIDGAVAYEIKRQSELLENQEKIIQETRGWNDAKGVTFAQREKEEAFDYRYFPEPDIPPLTISNDEIAKLRACLCELPSQRRARLFDEYGLDAASAEVFVANRQLGNFFEKTMSELEEWINVEEGARSNAQAESRSLVKLCSNYLISDVVGLLNGSVFDENNLKVSPENFAEFIKLIYRGEISSKIAKMVLEIMVKSGGDPTNIISEKGLAQINDETEIAKIIDEILAKNQKAVTDYKNGKSSAFQFLVGQTLAATQGKANPDAVKKILLLRLAS